MPNLTPSETEALKMFDERLPKMMVDLVWSITDGGCKTTEKQYLTYQDEPIREFEAIKDLFLTQLRLARADERNKAYEEGKNAAVDACLKHTDEMISQGYDTEPGALKMLRTYIEAARKS